MRTIRFPDPDRMMPHQQEVLWLDNHRFKVLIWHRRCRKTTTAINEIVKQAHITKGVYWHLFPTYTEAKNSIWRDPKMLFGIIPPELIESRNESELLIKFKNGSIYQLLGADNPDRLRGAGPMGVVLDEYDTMKNDVWPIVEPILRENGGWAWFIGTPKGKQKLYDLYNLGLKGEGEWKSWLIKASESGIISEEQLAESKKTMTQNLYNQEWECDFIEGQGSVFRGVREVCNATPTQPLIDHYYVMGVDLAKVQDWTVITVYDRKTNRQVYQDRFQTLEWPFQKSKIKAIADHYNKALVMLDATGVGDPIADDLLRAGVAVNPVKLTNESKKDIIEKLSIWIDQKRLSMINTEETLLEFDNFSYEITSSGKIVYNAREGYHDDIVVAHALAVWELQPLFVPETKLEVPPIKQEYLRRIKISQGGFDEDEYEAI
jgi:hypothetical protein